MSSIENTCVCVCVCVCEKCCLQALPKISVSKMLISVRLTSHPASNFNDFYTQNFMIKHSCGKYSHDNFMKDVTLRGCNLPSVSCYIQERAYSRRLFQGDNKLQFSHFECQSFELFVCYHFLFSYKIPKGLFVSLDRTFS